MSLRVNTRNNALQGIKNDASKNSIIVRTEETEKGGLFGLGKKTTKKTETIYIDDGCDCKNNQKAKLLQYLSALMAQIAQLFQQTFQQIAKGEDGSKSGEKQKPWILYATGGGLNCDA